MPKPRRLRLEHPFATNFIINIAAFRWPRT
jgi:hypothetical protein